MRKEKKMATDVRTGILEKEEYLKNARIMYSPVILALQNREFHNVDVSKAKFKELISWIYLKKSEGSKPNSPMIII